MPSSSSSARSRFSPRPQNNRHVRKYTTQVSYQYITDGAGRLDTRVADAGFGIDFQNGDGFDANYTRAYEFLRRPFRIVRGVTIPIGRYEYQEFSTVYLFGIQRRVSGSVSFARGSFYSGDRTAVGYRGRVEVTPQVSLEPRLSINRVVLEGRFTTKLVATRATYTMTPRMFFSGLLRYNSSNDTVNVNLRLRWEYNSGSEVFVVYTDERDTGAPGSPQVENRVFAIKINRLFASDRPARAFRKTRDEANVPHRDRDAAFAAATLLGAQSRCPLSPDGVASVHGLGEWVKSERQPFTRGGDRYQGGKWIDVTYGRPPLRGREAFGGTGFNAPLTGGYIRERTANNVL